MNSSTNNNLNVICSIPELVSYTCIHIKGQEKIGLEATKKCLQHYPKNEGLQRNKKYFENRLGTVTSFQHTHLPKPKQLFYNTKESIVLFNKQSNE